jgi:MoxR-like ATPase
VGEVRPDEGLGAVRVRVRTDDVDAVTTLLAELAARGFADVTVEGGVAADAPWRICGAGLGRASATRRALWGAVASLGSRIAPDRPVAIEVRGQGAPGAVVIDVPVRGVADGSREAHIGASARRYPVTVFSDREVPPALMTALAEAGFRAHTASPRPVAHASLRYGGAPDALLGRLGAIVSPFLRGVALRAIEAWGPEDVEVHLDLPGQPPGEGDAASVAPSECGEAAARAWVHRGGARSGRLEDFIALRGEEAVVGGVALPRGREADAAGALARFDHVAIDQATAETLHFLAEAVALGESASLEGPTSTSKSASILYLAALCARRVHRINLHGHAEAADLLGRWIPNEAPGAGAWRWVDGPVVQAARGGDWLCLDECNLAEPQAIESLNGLIDRDPHLRSGRDHAQIDVHGDFRVFSTMNVGYAGRSAMSPAWRNRWRATRVVAAPGEAELLQFLRAGVFGEAPIVEVAGQRWRCPPARAAWGSLAGAPGISSFLEALARFHASLDAAWTAGSAAPVGRDRPVVTRRDLISVLDRLALRGATPTQMRAALARYYLDRCVTGDRAVVVALLDAAGIGPSTWALQLSLGEGGRP